MTQGRTLPHSIEAEEYLLSCCLLDADVLARCDEAGVTPKSFYDAKHEIVYAGLLEIRAKGQPIDVAVLAEHLKASKDLERVGSYAFLAQVSGRIPTTAQAGYFIEKVREQQTLRDLIRLSTGAVEACHNYTGGELKELMDRIETDLSAVRHRLDAGERLKSPADFGLPQEDGPDELLGSNRYIGRGDQCLIVSSSGMGKSSLAFIWAVHIALGRSFLGIETKRPSKSLMIQAEDSDGDLGELWQSVFLEMKLTDEEIEKVRQNVIIVRDKINRGAAFITRMRQLIAKVKPDFVWLNPLHAYAGCDIANAEQIGQFLREGLNKANREDSFAYMIIHHTPKPMTGKAVADKKWHEFMYDAAGSAELVNWARAVITLKPTDTEGDFNLVLAKRGKRAGVTQEVEGEGGGSFLQPTTKIAIQQSTKKVMIEGRKKPFYILNWTRRDPDPEPEKPADRKGNASTFKPQYSVGELLSYFPAANKDGEGLASIQRFAYEGCAITKSTFLRWRGQLIEEGCVTQLEDKTYRRTAKGDAKAEEFLKSRP